MTNEELKKKIVDVLRGNIEYELHHFPDDNYTEVEFDHDKLADALIAAGIGDMTAHEAETEYWKTICKIESDEHHAAIKNAAKHARHLMRERDDSKIEYRGYQTYIHYSAADKVLYGKIEGIKDLVNFESHSVTEIEKEFHKAVDDYIEFCREVGKH